ncbi:uncharacterized protein [Primulina huaijiensis]|uniref:uncharacterized protein n=1 Tax=Primulina huaijiensis TaxID=1492673 RepID=UPI003CC787BA
MDYVLREIHEGCCGEYLGGIALARKAMLAGFWWPTVSQDAARVVRAYRVLGPNYGEESFEILWKNIVCRFGVLRRLISDNGRQFQGKEIIAWCHEMRITQSFTSVAYPQANGQTEVVNRIIVQALKTRLEDKGND